MIHHPDKKEGIFIMGSTRLSTHATLDRIVTFIHQYQQEHEGRTPPVAAVREGADIRGTGFSYFRDLLANSGRITVMQVKPLDVRITPGHPDNKRCLTAAPKQAFKAAPLFDRPEPDPDFDEVPVERTPEAIAEWDRFESRYQARLREDEAPVEPKPDFIAEWEQLSQDHKEQQRHRRLVEGQPSEVLVKVLIARGWDVTLRQVVKTP